MRAGREAERFSADAPFLPGLSPIQGKAVVRAEKAPTGRMCRPRVVARAGKGFFFFYKAV